MSSVTVNKVHSLTGHRDCVYTLTAHKQPNLFFSGSGDGMVVLWDLRNPAEGQLVARLPNSVYALRYIPSRDVLVAGHNYDGIHLLDVETKTEVGSLKMTDAAIFDIQEHDGFLYVGAGDGTLSRVDPVSLNVVAKATASQRSARCIAIDGKRGEVAVGYSDNMIRIFDLDLRLKKEFAAHGNSVFALRYTPDFRFLVSGSRDARLKFWNADTGQLDEEIVAHLFAINHVDYSPDTKHFVTCSLDKTIKVWDASERKLLKVVDRARHGGHVTSVNKVLWTPFQDQIISASDDRTISVWHMIF